MCADTEWEWCGDFDRVYLKKRETAGDGVVLRHRKNAIEIETKSDLAATFQGFLRRTQA
jgi:hypothetical protein